MKKILSFILILTLSLTVLAACGGKEDEETAYTLGIGVVMKVDEASATAESTVAAVVTDGDGKIVECRIDAIDYTAAIDETRVPKSVLPVSKRDQGDNYGMLAAWGSSLAEWYRQAEAFETYVTGKTLAEVRAIALDENGKATDAELTAGCTITVSDLIAAVDKAMSSEHKVEFSAKGDLTAAVAVLPELEAKAETLTYEYTVNYAAVVAAGETTVAAILDAADVTMVCTADADGKLVASSSTYNGTKLEQGDDYNMVEYGQAQSEWYVQALLYAKTAIGKAPTALDAIPTEGVAGCTIGVESYKAALVKAGKAVR